MSKRRNDKEVTKDITAVTYTSFEQLRPEFGLKPIKRRTDNEQKLKSQQEKFLGTCRVCKQPLSWIEGTNVCTCKNEQCKGIEKTGIHADGTEYVYYIPVTRILDEKGMKIAMNLFS